MFTTREIRFLKMEIGGLVEKTQEKLDQDDVEGAKRHSLEERLITAVSVVNKLENLRPEKEEQKKDAKVLIVDDVESMRKVHRHYFLEVGFRNIDMAADGLQAYKMMRAAIEMEKPYSLVISDWEMPKVSGLDLLRKVRTDKNLWRTAFFLITALGDKPHIVQAINAGATGYMVKPLNQKIVNKKFVDYLD